MALKQPAQIYLDKGLISWAWIGFLEYKLVISGVHGVWGLSHCTHSTHVNIKQSVTQKIQHDYYKIHVFPGEKDQYPQYLLAQ